MCGIAGLITCSGGGRAGDVGAAAGRMAATLAHRGPDAAGVWADPAEGVALAHRRLSILDLSSLGAQPMASPSERYTVVFNGEVYNFPDLRRELEGCGARFRGHSDTEVLASGFDEWGVEGTVARSVGMFALAVWDASERALVLARDRMGQKPLYYGWAADTLVFGSELKALQVHPDFRADVDRDALALYFMYGHVPGPHTIYQGVRMLPPGCTARLAPSALRPGADLAAHEVPYWTLSGAIDAGRRRPFEGTDTEAVDELESLLDQVVRDRLVADVPVGAFLSGGVDSTAVVAAAQRASPLPVQTFTIGFREGAYDESPYAEAVARVLGTDHETLHVDPADALALIPRLGAIWDEPFADSSQIATVLVSQFARERVTVALSGDGGDELFGGYNRHVQAPMLWDAMRHVPRPVRAGVGAALRAVPPAVWDRAYAAVEPALPARARVALPADKASKLGGALGARSGGDLYTGLVRMESAGWPPVIGAAPPATLADRPGSWPLGLSSLEQLLYLDSRTYLPDDILTKVDRATMSASLEGRAPFMDHRVVEFAWTLPDRVKVRNGRGKWVLRQAVDRAVPREIMDRPKAGFAVPVGDWLRGPLRPWAESLLDSARIRREGYLDPATVASVWEAHLSGRSDRRSEVWSLLMFQAWLDEVRPGPAPSR